MINWGIKKYKTYNNLQKIVDKYKVEITAEQTASIEKLLNKGDTVFMYFNPFDAEIHETNSILWDKNEEEFLNSIYTSAEEI